MSQIACPSIHVTMLPLPLGLKCSPLKPHLTGHPHFHQSIPTRIASFSCGHRCASGIQNPTCIQHDHQKTVRLGISSIRRSPKNRQQRKRSAIQKGSARTSEQEVSDETSTNDEGDRAALVGVEESDGARSSAVSANIITTMKKDQKPDLPLMWKEIQGSKNWNDLLDPIHLLLRRELIRYGEFAQACYDGFDNEENTKYRGSCRFNKVDLFSQIDLLDSGYKITKYLYTTDGPDVSPTFIVKHAVRDRVWSTDSNWIGFVAVTMDGNPIKRLGRRDILVAWRGSVTNLDWKRDVENDLVPTGEDRREPDVRVAKGFLSLYTSYNHNSESSCSRSSAGKQAKEEVRRLVKKYAKENLSITVTGHSLGGALAVICAYDIAKSAINQPEKFAEDKSLKEWTSYTREDNIRQEVVAQTKDPSVKTVPVTVFTFGGPKVGNRAFRDLVDHLQVKVLRVEHVGDVVPSVPILPLRWPIPNWIVPTFPFLLQRLQAFWERLPYIKNYTYAAVGKSITIDNSKSTKLKKQPFWRVPLWRVLQTKHNLEAGYLHTLTGYQGKDKPFDPQVPRDLWLVNKATDLLIDNDNLPPANWGEYWKFKGIFRVRDKYGNWKSYPRNTKDYPECCPPGDQS